MPAPLPRAALIRRQIVWRNTKRVGMGMANSSDGKVWVVARYVTPGNVVGQCATTAKN